MNYKEVLEENNKIIIKGVKDFNIKQILECGQCFRWEKQEDSSYIGIALGKVVKISMDDKDVIIDNCTEEDYALLWEDYLDMKRDYGSIKNDLTKEDNVLKKAAEYGYGIRILKQDFWETVVSFIISQNNNIPRIKGCIESISKAFGDYAGEYGGKEYYSIPTPEKMASLTLEDLAPAKLGYRAGYLIKMANQMLEAGGPEAVKEKLLVAEDPIAELQAFCGIGPKVAACISLFGLGRMDAFPIDVWMRRVMNQLYDIDEKDLKTMKAYAKEHFGEFGGIAQQYLFYYIRSL